MTAHVHYEWRNAFVDLLDAALRTRLTGLQTEWRVRFRGEAKSEYTGPWPLVVVGMGRGENAATATQLYDSLVKFTVGVHYPADQNDPRNAAFSAILYQVEDALATMVCLGGRVRRLYVKGHDHDDENSSCIIECEAAGLYRYDAPGTA